ncbi:Replication factor A protein 1 [Puccinia graminis f. sp. tritici]|nr:Replication factor A protein 1 [Puccinia graminis f. sp. tritici]
MTLWGKTAETFEAPTESIVAFQGVKVGDFGGRNLSMISSSVMLVNPDIPEAFDLKGWYDNEGVNAKIQSFANTGTGIGREITEDSLKTVAEIKDTQLGMNERGDYFNFRATIMYIKSETISYPACPTERCNKKLLRDGDDEWRCEKCDKLFPAPDHRYLIQMTVQDHTGTLWLSGFNEVGQIILPMNANELIGIKETDEAQYQKIVTDATAKTYTMVCRAKEETYNDVNRTKYSVLRIAPVDWVAAGLQLAETLLKNYSA